MSTVKLRLTTFSCPCSEYMLTPLRNIQEIQHCAAAAKSLQSCSTLCDPIDGSPSGSPIPGILQARTLEWVAIAFSNAWKWKVKSENEVKQSCLTLCDPMDRSLSVSSIHGIFQARVLEWDAIAFSIHHCASKFLRTCSPKKNDKIGGWFDL